MGFARSGALPLSDHLTGGFDVRFWTLVLACGLGLAMLYRAGTEVSRVWLWASLAAFLSVLTFSVFVKQTVPGSEMETDLAVVAMVLGLTLTSHGYWGRFYLRSQRLHGGASDRSVRRLRNWAGLATILGYLVLEYIFVGTVLGLHLG